jgi:hypothetical protein
MPRGRRSPIEYTPQFGAGIFRPKATVDEELAELGHDAVERAVEPAPPPGDGTTPETRPTAVDGKPAPRRRAGKSRSNDGTDERTNGRTDDRTDERSRVRHSFDVWRDQLLALTQIQVERFDRTGKKPKLGELVQEALDAYIAQQRKRTNERTNEYADERP